MQGKFPLGRTHATSGALSALETTGQSASEFFQRHACGDWGEALCEEDGQANDEALLSGEGLMSAYYLRNGQELWIVTERDRSATTALLPNEY